MTKMATWFLAGTLGLSFGAGRAALAADRDTDEQGATDTDNPRATDTGNTDEARPTKGTERDLQMSDLPSAVRSTFKHEAKGGKVEDLRKQTKSDGSVVYEGEIVKKGKGRALEVNSDGMVVDRGKSHDEKTEQGSGEK